MTKKTTPKVDMSQIMSNPHYRGKHVVVVKGKIFTANTGEKAGQLLEKAHKEFPNQMPQITYVPDADTLTL